MPFYWPVEWFRYSENKIKNGLVKDRMKNKAEKMREWFIKTWSKVKNGLLKKKYRNHQYNEMRRDQELEEFYQLAWEWNEEELDLELCNKLKEKTPLMYVNNGISKKCIYSYYN